MPYITPPPVLPSDVGTDFLLDEILEDTTTLEEEIETLEQKKDKNWMDEMMLDSFTSLSKLTIRKEQSCQ